MKIHWAVAGLLLAGIPAQAASTVCSSTKLYYSGVQYDFGTPPPAGRATGKIVIVHDGEVLVNYTSVQDAGQPVIQPYYVRFIGDSKILETTGNSVAGARVFRQAGVLVRVDPLNPSVTDEVVTEQLLCTATWAFAP